MVVIIAMVFYTYGIIGIEFFNMRTHPPPRNESPYQHFSYTSFDTLELALLTLF